MDDFLYEGAVRVMIDLWHEVVIIQADIILCLYASRVGCWSYRMVFMT